METKPDMLWQMAQHIRQVYTLKGQDVSVHITANTSINNNLSKLLIDPNVDMAKADWDWFKHNDWMLIY